MSGLLTGGVGKRSALTFGIGLSNAQPRTYFIEFLGVIDLPAIELAIAAEGSLSVESSMDAIELQFAGGYIHSESIQPGVELSVQVPTVEVEYEGE